MCQQQEDAEKMAILKNGAERGELVNTLEEELQKTKKLMTDQHKETERLSTELDNVKAESDKLESSRQCDQLNLQSSRDEVNCLQSEISKLRDMCDAKDEVINRKEQTIEKFEQDNRDLAMQKNAVQK